MPPRIRILPENLTNKIAAGEVVERPASVVKELVENALDAGCSEITVEIEGGGKRLIKVTDNGCGMSRDDALLSLERHATSKITDDSDLFKLATLGFRGEALPSIASVSRLTLASRERGKIEGAEIYAEGGKIREVKVCGMAEGTIVSVRNLFFNTPARLKFLKSNETEAGHVGDLMTRLALSRPEVRFTYVNDGKMVFRVLNSDLRERVVSLLGRSLADGLYPAELNSETVSVRGLVARPETSRSAAGHLYTYINGRYIRDKVVQHAILQGYRNFLERGRYPVVVLFIDVPAGEVDVNVHPTKHEVRFREQSAVHDALQAAVEGVLRATPWQRRSEAPMGTAQAVQNASPSINEQRISEVREVLTHYYAGPPEVQPALRLPVNAVRPEISTAQERTQRTAEERRLPDAPAGYFSSLTVIGQFHASYIVCQDGSDLVLIDQHAAHERVAFESLKAQFAAGTVETQGLLFPETAEFSFKEAAAITEHREYLSRLGFALEPFGGTTWLIQGVPRFLAQADPLRALRDILEELLSLGKSRVFTDVLEDILSRIACHSVVRGVHPLTLREIEALFASMDATEYSSNCPHGRPVLQRLTLGEIEKMFKRG